MNTEAPSPPSAWRFFPYAIIGALAVVVAVNAAMITTAVEGFPGRTGRNGFDLSNEYDKVLAEAQHEKALGWKVHTTLRDGLLVLNPRDKDGRPLKPTRIHVDAQRPVGPAHEHTVELALADDGTYVAKHPLQARGQWDVLITIDARGETLHATRRLSVP